MIGNNSPPGVTLTAIVKENVNERQIVDSLGEVSSVDKTPLIAIYEEPLTHFINTNGEKIITTQSHIFSNDYMCSFTRDDFFVVGGSNSKKIIMLQELLLEPGNLIIPNPNLKPAN